MGWFSRKNDRAGSGGTGTFEAAARTAIADDPVQAAFELRRYGLLARAPAAWRQNSALGGTRQSALQKLDEAFALVADGRTSLPLQVNAQPGCPERDVQTTPFLLARHAVTHGDYQLFVDAGAYDDSALWPEEVWPHLIKFRDQSGAPAPRYWCDGRHDQRLARHPVVGICWYEAAIYAAWAGYRLPTEAEWQVAAAWQLGAAAATPRRYPWGDAFDLECCNIWASGHNHTLPVEACPAGATPNGVLQLVGNTWEWVDGEFDCTDDDGRTVVGEAPLKSIRGGAFDTYFPWQATSMFRSGLPGLVRTHNVGFRCAMDLIAEE